MTEKGKISDTVQLALFVAIIVLLAVTPLGYLSLGVINATTVQIPVIIGGILFGWKKGAFLGGVFGVTSLLKNTFQPNITSFVFSPFVPVFGETAGSALSIIVCMVPRIMIGVVAALLFEMLRKRKATDIVSAAAAGFMGSLTNTVLVMGGIYLFFGRSYSAAQSMAYESLIGTVMATITGIGITEAVISAVIAAAVTVPIISYLKKKKA